MRVVLLLSLLAASAPAVAGLPATCADPCVVTSDVDLYTTPAAIVASGGSVVFTASSGSHVNLDGTGVGDFGTCFFVGNAKGRDSVPVQLVIRDGALYGSHEDSKGALVEKECTSAQALPDGSFALPFYCYLHTQMRGVLVVASG